MNFKKALSLLAAIAVFVAACGSALADNTDITDITEESGVDTAEVGTADEYKQVAQNNDLIMYANLTVGLFYLQNKSDGNVVHSTVDTENDNITAGKEKLILQSQIYIDYINDEDFVNSGTYSTVNSKVACVNKGLVTVKEIENGIRVTYNFETQSIVIPVEYTLSDKGFSAKIITNEITEGDECKLYRVYLLPSFGAALNDQSGYLLIPDGCGALAEFNNGATYNTYDSKVYGEELSVKKLTEFSDTEEIKLPVFGISSQNGGVFGIITEGDFSASIRAAVSNESYGANTICSVLDYRVIDFDYALAASWVRQEIYRYSMLHYSLDSFEVRYNLLGTDNNSYTDMAKLYRDYLVNEKGVASTQDSTVLNLDVYGAFETEKNFLGIKYKKLLPLTTYSQATDIVKEFAEKGVTAVGVRFNGWQNDGIFNYKLLISNKILSVLGGNADFKKMNSYFEENGVPVSYEADLISYRSGSTKQAAATVYNKPATQYQYSLSNYLKMPDYRSVEPWYNLSIAKLEKNSRKYLSSLKDGVTTLSLSTLMNEVYSDFRKSVNIYRSEYGNIVTPILEEYKKSGITLTGNSVNAYAFPYVSKIFNAPTNCSGYELFTKEVPFYQIVLHGIIPMTTEAQQAEIDTSVELLKSAETGTGLLYNCIYADSSVVRDSREEYLYSATYTLWKDKATEKYNQLKPIIESVSEAVITKHGELAVNVTETVYDNGKAVITNYSDSDFDSEYGTVAAKSFKLITGKGATK